MACRLKYLLVLGLAVLACSCSPTRRLERGQYLLTKNKVDEDKDAPRKERIKAADVDGYIQTEPNRRFLGTNLYLQLYNMAHPDTARKNWWNRTLRRLGDEPVLLDSAAVRRSADLIHDYVQYSGFYDSEVDYRVDTTRRKRARVTYLIEQHEPYRIGDITYEFRDEFLRQVVMQDSANTLLRSGDILDGNVLSNEKERITWYLRNNGYYDFTQNMIEFYGDATDNPRVKDLVVEFKQRISDYTSEGQPVYENSSIYRISRIIINPNFDPMLAATDENYYNRMDTTEYRGLYVMHPRGHKPKVKEEILRQAVSLYPNYVYDEDLVRRSHSNLLRLGYYRNSNIVFYPDDETGEDNLVTFIGGDDDRSAGGTTTEKYLTCYITCVPTLRQGYKIELEGTTSSSFNAVSATVGYQNRNFFRGAELFEVTFTGGYEFLRTGGANFELGGGVSLSFPRFLTPFNVDRYNRAVNPRTKVEVSVNAQNRKLYNRTLSSIGWGYSWSNRRRSSFSVKPVDLNLIKRGYIDEEYFESIENPYLRNSYEDQLVGGISGTYVFNSQLGASGLGNKSFVLRFNWETAGNLFNLATRIFSNPVRDGERDYYKIFGIRYGQYFRIDGSISDRIIFGPKTNIAFRLYGGYGRAYGNATSIPFDRLFWAGGSNSMRGWIPRKLGPGNSAIINDTYPNQLGDMKLEANMEFRFPVWKFLRGAVFFDLGNIWNIKKQGQDQASVFRFDRFYKQLGLNTGLGMRFDINVAVIRFDFGYKLHNPNEPAGHRWVERFKIGDTVINFGVGYPF